ncbi:helix-turn-helix domain-containing protein [Flavobacteriaceae bacterium M23B6Z8]
MFPDFNLYSTPLLLLVLQGLIFALLLLNRYRKEKFIPDLLLALLLIITGYHRTSYTIGFMGWYDTFQNTKINYYLINFSFALGPLIYFYVASTLKANFTFKKIHLLHLLPVTLYIIYRLIILFHDMNSPGWDTGYNGEWELKYNQKYGLIVTSIFNFAHQLLYYAFTIQLYFAYRQKIKQYFSNTYRLELNWLRNFLLIFVFLFIYSNVQIVIDEFINLSWIDRWYIQLLSSIALVYLGIKAYFTDVSGLRKLTFQLPENKSELKSDKTRTYDKEINLLINYMRSEKPYLNPELTMPQLADSLQMSPNELSEVINQGLKMNFNDYINSFRVENVKSMLPDPKYAQLSMLGIAFESGFNSKATFNRVFKKFAGVSPSAFMEAYKKRETS